MTSFPPTIAATAILILAVLHSICAAESDETWVSLQATTVELAQEHVRSAHTLERQAKGLPDLEALRFELFLPCGAPPDTQILVHLKDRDGFWFQYLLPYRLRPGETNKIVVSLAPDVTGWQPVGHHGAWNFQSSFEPVEIGMKVLSK